MNGPLLTILAFVVMLGILIFVHELGHFLAAKAAGIHVHRFSLGIGNPIPWLTTTYKGTEYSISWLPLGGYVKMASREEESAMSALEGGAANAAIPEDQMYEAKPIWARMIVILAGVTMNVLFAWFVFTGLLVRNGESVTPITVVGAVAVDKLPAGAEGLATLVAGDTITAVNGAPVESWQGIGRAILEAPGASVRLDVAHRDPIVLAIPAEQGDLRRQAFQALQPWLIPVVGVVVQGRPAAVAGILPGDTIVAVDSAAVAQWGDVLDAVGRNAGEEVAIDVRRQGERRRFVLPTFTVKGDTLPDGRARAQIGIALQPPVRRMPIAFAQAVIQGLEDTRMWALQIGGTVRGLVAGRVSSRDLGGPILIGQMAGEAARAGLDAFLGLMAVLSVNLAVLNLLPIPVLDGGQFLFLAGEAVLRRPLSRKVREILTMIGLVLILALMLLAFGNDIRRLLGL